MIAAATAAAAAPPGQKPAAKELEQAIPDFVVPPEARESVTQGRLKIMDQIKQDAQHALAQDGNKEGQTRGRGIELVDVGLSRIEFVPQVREAAFERAVSLMEAIATKTTSEGEQRKKEIINKTGAEVQKIEGEGKQEANILKGKADADIIDSYAKAIRETGEFYTFIRTLEAYKEALKRRHPAHPHHRQLAPADDQEAGPGQARIQAQPHGIGPAVRIGPGDHDCREGRSMMPEPGRPSNMHSSMLPGQGLEWSCERE